MSTFQKISAAIHDAVPAWVRLFNRKYQDDAVRRMNDVLKASGMSQRDLAKRAGWTPAYVSRILSGGENLTLRTVARFEDAVGADVLTVSTRPPTRTEHSVTIVTNALPSGFEWSKGSGLARDAGRRGVTVTVFARSTSDLLAEAR